jgi:hypothetical protein
MPVPPRTLTPALPVEAAMRRGLSDLSFALWAGPQGQVDQPSYQEPVCLSPGKAQLRQETATTSQ